MAAAGERRSEYVAAALVLSEPTKVRDRGDLDRTILSVLSWGLPMVGISPSVASHMPKALIDAARHRLLLTPPMPTWWRAPSASSRAGAAGPPISTASPRSTRPLSRSRLFSFR